MTSFISPSLKVRKVQLAAYKIVKIKYIKDLIDLQESGFPGVDLQTWIFEPYLICLLYQ